MRADQVPVGTPADTINRLTSDQKCAELGVHLRTLDNWMAADKVIPACRFPELGGRRPRWWYATAEEDADAVELWLLKQRLEEAGS